MGDFEDAGIFDSGNAPEAPATETPVIDTGSSAPNLSEHDAVSAAISNLSRVGGRDQPVIPGPPQPTEPTQPTQQPTAPTAPNAPDVEDKSTAGLLKALLDERALRQNLEREAADRRKREEQAEAERRANQTPFDQRLFEQPQQTVTGAIDERLQPIEQRLQTMATDFDFRVTRAVVGGEAFDQAFKDWYALVGNAQAPNPTLYHTVMGAKSPGEALMNWHRQHSMLSEIGDDFAGYKAKLEAEILARHGITLDQNGQVQAPTPQARIEPPRAPNGQFTSPPARHELRLPTKTAAGGRTGSGTPEQALDGSEDAIFNAGRSNGR